MRIQVTEKHIEKGVAGAADCCPVALALGDAGFHDPHVGPYSMSALSVDGGRRSIGLPLVVKAFVSAFDARRHTEPFAFDLGDERCASWLR